MRDGVFDTAPVSEQERELLGLPLTQERIKQLAQARQRSWSRTVMQSSIYNPQTEMLVPEASRLAGTSQMTFHRWCRDGLIKHQVKNGHVVVDRAWLEQAVAAGTLPKRQAPGRKRVYQKCALESCQVLIPVSKQARFCSRRCVALKRAGGGDITLKEAATILGISHERVSQLQDSGKLPSPLMRADVLLLQVVRSQQKASR